MRRARWWLCVPLFVPIFFACAEAKPAPRSLACAPSSEEAPPIPAGTPWHRTELFFGRNIPGGGNVSDRDLREFVAAEICPRFPSGFTLLDATGAWRDHEGALIGEQTRVLLLLHPDTPHDDRAIDQIRAEYMKQFHQESVLRVDEAARVAF